MKKFVAIALATELMLSSVIYPSAMVVANVNKHSYKLRTSTGITYTVKRDPEDLEVGDLVATIMYSKGTKCVRDDEVLIVRYSGFDIKGG